MIYTVTLSPTLDYFITPDNMTVGAINSIAKSNLLPGGKGINCSQVLSRLGVENIATGFAGGSLAEVLRSELDSRGVNHHFIKTAKNTVRLNVKLRHQDHNNSGGAMIETDFNGTSQEVSEWELDDLINFIDGSAAEDDTIIIAGSVPPTTGHNLLDLRDIIHSLSRHHLSHRRRNIIVDVSGEELLQSLGAEPFLVKPNIDELAEFFGVSASSIKGVEDVVKYSKMLQDDGVKNVITSMGGDGAVMITDNGSVLFAPPIELPSGMVSTVGAGDSLVAGFAAVLEEHRGGAVDGAVLRRAFRQGVACATATVQCEGLCTSELATEMFYLVRINKLDL